MRDGGDGRLSMDNENGLVCAVVLDGKGGGREIIPKSVTMVFLMEW